MSEGQWESELSGWDSRRSAAPYQRRQGVVCMVCFVPQQRVAQQARATVCTGIDTRCAMGELRVRQLPPAHLLSSDPCAVSLRVWGGVTAVPHALVVCVCLTARDPDGRGRVPDWDVRGTGSNLGRFVFRDPASEQIRDRVASRDRGSDVG